MDLPFSRAAGFVAKVLSNTKLQIHFWKVKRWLIILYRLYGGIFYVQEGLYNMIKRLDWIKFKNLLHYHVFCKYQAIFGAFCESQG